MTKGPFDPAAIRELATILTETGLTEIEISDKDRSIRVARQPSQVVTTASVSAPISAAAVAPAPPDDQAVAAGQTLLLIEAMKTFNQIKAARAGTVVRVLVASGEAVEYGQALMVLE